MIRKGERRIPADEQDAWQSQGIKVWLSDDVTLEELREVLIEQGIGERSISMRFQFPSEKSQPNYHQEAGQNKRLMVMIPLRPMEKNKSSFKSSKQAVDEGLREKVGVKK